jgi:leader peptidase (prepilin peptidase)/N-methyltransferase
MLQSWLMLASCLVGSVIGSFVALVADRWPRGEDMVLTPSRCRACGHRLRPANLVPVVSYCRQRGRCVWCRAPLPGDLLLAELGGAAIAWLAVIRGSDLRGAYPAAILALAGFGWALLLLALLDARHLWLPDAITLPLALAGLAAAAILPEPTLAARLAGAVLGYGALEGLRRAYRWWRGREGLGGGDPKLLAAIGAWLGVGALPGVVLIAALAGLAWAGLERWRGRPAGGTIPVPLGTSLAASALLWLAFVPQSFTLWYSEMI